MTIIVNSRMTYDRHPRFAIFDEQREQGEQPPFSSLFLRIQFAHRFEQAEQREHTVEHPEHRPWSRTPANRPTD